MIFTLTGAESHYPSRMAPDTIEILKNQEKLLGRRRENRMDRVIGGGLALKPLSLGEQGEGGYAVVRFCYSVPERMSPGLTHGGTGQAQS